MLRGAVLRCCRVQGKTWWGNVWRYELRVVYTIPCRLCRAALPWPHDADAAVVVRVLGRLPAWPACGSAQVHLARAMERHGRQPVRVYERRHVLEVESGNRRLVRERLGR